MSREMNSVDDFLSHETGSRTAFLKSWKQRKPPILDMWLHTKQLPVSVPQHRFKRIVLRDDEQKIWGWTLNCWEDEQTIRYQYQRYPDGSRKQPPTRCAMCRLIEVVRQKVAREELSPIEPIFQFETDTDTELIHAAGLYGMMKKDELTDDEYKAARKAHVDFREVWSENGSAKINYILSIVDNDDAGGGVQITTEPALVGDKIKAVIRDTRISLGDKDAGDPFRNPYCIQLEFNPADNIPFEKKYTARALQKVKLTPEIEALIRGPAPDVKSLTRIFNRKELRAALEQVALVQLPWDEIFDVKAEEGEDDDPAQLPEPKESAEDDEVCPECGPGKECPHVACDACGKPILESADACRHCGHVYEKPALAAPTQRMDVGKGKGDFGKGEKQHAEKRAR